MKRGRRTSGGSRRAAAGVAADGVDERLLRSFLGYNVRRAELYMRQDFDRTFRRKGLRPPEFSVLVLVADNPLVTQAALAGTLAIARPNMVGLIDRLEKRGLLERTVDDTDRRSHGLRLTPKGAALAAQAKALGTAGDRAAAAHLTEAERATLLRLLRKLYDR